MVNREFSKIIKEETKKNLIAWKKITNKYRKREEIQRERKNKIKKNNEKYTFLFTTCFG